MRCIKGEQLVLIDLLIILPLLPFHICLGILSAVPLSS